MNILEYESYHENKSHGDMGFPYNTYLCSIPLDFTKVPLHWHDEMEIIYIKKGKGIIAIDFRQYIVKAPTIILIIPGQLHSIEQLENFTMEYENILFHPNMLLSKQNDSSNTDFLLPLLNGTITVPTIFTPAYPYYQDVASPIDACDEICKTKPRGYEFCIKSQLYQLLFVLINRCQNLKQPAKRKRNLQKMKSVLKYVENNYMKPISISEIAAIAEFSESHFMRYFKETMGSSFIDYLKDYRLTMAARLLITSEASILYIASEVGFENLSYFNRAFKSRYGMTPSQYRNS